MLRLLEIFFTKKTRASANTGGRFGGDGSEGNGPEAVKEALMTGPGIWIGPEDNWEVRQLKWSGMLVLEWAVRILLPQLAGAICL